MFCVLMLFVSFVCFKQKTAYEMRISDWSSDVCSSDLFPGDLVGLQGAMAEPLGHGVEALTPVTLCVLPRGKLYEIFRVHPELGFDMTWLGRSAARRVGNECVSKCRSQWSPLH